MGIPYRTALAVRPPEGHELRDARMGILFRTALAVRLPRGYQMCILGNSNGCAGIDQIWI